jgi:hypothetical protein
MRLLPLATALLLAAPLLSADDRAPPPAAAAQAQADTAIKDLFKDDFAKRKPGDSRALAAKLTKAAADADGDPVRKFVLLRLAAEAAARAGDSTAALQAIDAQAQEFAVDAPALKADALEAALHATGGAQPDYEAILDAALELAAGAQAADDYGTAVRLLHTARATAVKRGDNATGTVIGERGRLVEAMQKEYETVKGDFAVLKDKPEDPTACLHVGRFLCFFKGDWDKGLPLLALGGDAKLQTLAKKDLDGPTGAEEQAALADAWMEAAEAESGVPAQQIELHAYALYKQAAPQLTGPAKIKADERIKKLDKIAARLTLPEGNVSSDTGWFVLFRSADPSLWDTDTDNGKNNFAVALSKAPDGVQFLRMTQTSAKEYAIIPMTNDELKKQSDDGMFGWQGEASLTSGAYHLGIYRLPLGAHSKGEVVIYQMAAAMSATGWGFGRRTGANGPQGRSWAGVSLPSSAVFEIAVKAGPLSEKETLHLLGKKGK